MGGCQHSLNSSGFSTSVTDELLRRCFFSVGLEGMAATTSLASVVAGAVSAGTSTAVAAFAFAFFLEGILRWRSEIEVGGCGTGK